MIESLRIIKNVVANVVPGARSTGPERIQRYTWVQGIEVIPQYAAITFF